MINAESHVMQPFVTGLGMLEGPVNRRDGAIIAVAMDLGIVYEIVGGEVGVLADTGGGPNGATEGPDGAIYIAQNGGTGPALNHRRAAPGILRIAPDGAVTAFGEPMTSPNDLCFGPDGYLYVTDPTRKPERDDGRIWRCNIETQVCELLLACDWYPNGIGFSAEDDVIYVADSRHRRIVRFPLDGISERAMRVPITLDHGIPDGFAFDLDGDLAIACPDFGPDGGDVQVYRDGKLVRLIDPGQSALYTNLSISPAGQLYLCDATAGTILTLAWPSAGLPLHPFRSGSRTPQLSNRDPIA